MKKFIYPLLVVLSLVVAGTSVYSFYSVNKEVKNLRTEKNLLSKDYDTLEIKEKNSKKEFDKLKQEFDKQKKELDSLKKESNSNSNENISYSSNAINQENNMIENTDSISPEETEKMYEFGKKENERIAKEQAEIESASNEPQYATYSEGTPYRFLVENNITLEELQALNPGTSDITIGSTYQIK